MQTSSLSSGSVEVRCPWPDELPRLRHFLPAVFLLDARPEGFVVVRGRVERIVAAAALSQHKLADGSRVGVLHLRADATGGEYFSLATALSQRTLAAAWQAGSARVFLGQTVEESSDLAGFWQHQGFTPVTTHEVYELPVHPLWERLEHIHSLLSARGLIPANAQVLGMLPRLFQPVHRFLIDHLPAATSLLSTQSAGYHPDHSLVLMVGGEVKGVLLCRRQAGQAVTGLRLVAPELRGGLAWANLLLLHRSVDSGLRSGLETCRFELNPAEHADTRQLAQFEHARLAGRRLFLGIEKKRLTNMAAPF